MFQLVQPDDETRALLEMTAAARLAEDSRSVQR